MSMRCWSGPRPLLADSDRPQSLRAACIGALSASDLGDKCSLTRQAHRLWRARTLSRYRSSDLPVPLRPGRPDTPVLVPPNKVPRRSLESERGRIAMIHALAHIELNAIDLALDIVARFADKDVPPSFFDGWMGVADDEARHYGLLQDRLAQLGSHYGALPAHDGLWEAATDTAENLHARLAIVPLVLEARGLDVTPSLLEKLGRIGDHETASILSIIYEDEKTHVAVGAKWFRFLCARNHQDPAAAFQALVRRHFRGDMKPPFNDLARASAGLTPSFYRSLTSASRS